MKRVAVSKIMQPMDPFCGMLSTSSKMHALFQRIKKVARSDVSVLVRGETGTGKELVARAIHRLSPRSQQPWMDINCATLTPELLRSELFGHRKGAFTGAVSNHPGLLKSAHKGTVFLDEVAEIPIHIQGQLLRVLQERSFVPVGGTRIVKVDVRVVSATHKALRQEVQGQRFRADLMYRLRVVPLYLPPLRERDGDLAALLGVFIQHLNKERKNSGWAREIRFVESKAFDALLSFRWPGNIRELYNMLEYAWLMGEGDTLRFEDLTPELKEDGSVDGIFIDTDTRAAEKQRLIATLRTHEGSRRQSAEALGISRTTLWRKLREHHID